MINLDDAALTILEKIFGNGECKYKKYNCPWSPLPNGLCASNIEARAYKTDGRPARCYEKMREREPELKEQERKRQIYRLKLRFRQIKADLTEASEFL